MAKFLVCILAFGFSACQPNLLWGSIDSYLGEVTAPDLNADGLAYDTASGHLYYVSHSNTLTEISLTSFIAEYDFVGDDDSVGLTFLPNGNLVASDHGTGRILEITTTGGAVTGGIDFFEPTMDAEGIVYHASRDSLFIVGNDTEVWEYSTSGTLLNSFTVPGVTDLEAITVDLDGNLLVGDDDDTIVRALDPLGNLLWQVNVANIAGYAGQITDIEGMTVDLINNRLFVSGDSEGISIFSISPGPQIPEPSCLTVFLGLGGLGLAMGRRTRRMA